MSDKKILIGHSSDLDATFRSESRGLRAELRLVHEMGAMLRRAETITGLLREARHVVDWGAGGGLAALGNRPALINLLARIDAALASGPAVDGPKAPLIDSMSVHDPESDDRELSTADEIGAGSYLGRGNNLP